MRTPSGILHIVDFKTSQIVSAIQPKDYWDDKRHWEIKNNIDTLEFKVFDNTTYAATLMQQNLVLKEVRDGRIVPYVITEVEKDPNDRSVITYASGAWINLAKDDYIRPQKIEGKTVNEFMGIALAGTKWKIGKTEHNGSHSMTIDEFTDPLTFLKQIASSFELEIQYRAEVVGSQIVGRYVDMVKKRGRDTKKEVTLGKDLMGIKRIENSQNICTALLGFVKKEGGEFITIAEINNGIPYLVDDGAFQRWNEKGQHKFGFYSPETENQDMTPERLKTLMKTEIEKRVNTSVSYEVQAQSIGQVFGLAHELINEGDTIRIIDRGFTPKLYLEARAIAGDESFKDPTQDKYVFGDYREIIDSNEELRRMYQKILASLQDKVPQGWFDALKDNVKDQGLDIQDAINKSKQAQQESKTAKDLAEATQDYMEKNLVDIIESVKPPTTDLKANKTLWRDISNGKPGILKIWTGTAWESVVPDTAPLQQSIKDVKKDIETAKTELNQKVLSVEGKAQEIAGQIVDVQNQVNDKVDQTWINNQLKDKADKSGVYTKDEVENGFIGKQIYETDKNGNVKKFQDINTSISQTNEALKQKAEKSELTKINDGLSRLESKTNEIISTADGTKQTISNLKTQVDNIQVGGRNLLLETAIKLHSVKTGENKQHTYFDLAKDAATLMQGKNLAMSFLFTGKVTAWGTTNKWAGFEVKITFTDNTFHYPSCRIENRLTLGKQYNQERFTASAVVMDKPIKEISVYALARDFTGDVLIEKLKLEIGTISTAWTPAPEDQVSTTDFTKKTVEIETTIKGINTSVSNVQNEQGKLTERVTKSEQTADGFKQSIESLTKKDSEISNKLNMVESNVDGNTKLITSVDKKIDGIDSDVTNLMVGTKELVTPVYFKGGTVKLSQDKFNGNAVVDITGAWHGLSYHIVNLVKPNKIKIGDKVTYSVWARLKDAPDGVQAKHSIYDGLGFGPELPSVDNQWKQFSGTFTVEKKHMDATDQLIRVEPWEWSGGDRKYIYQQSSPMISVTTKAYPWRPAPEDIGDGNVLTKVTTEIKEQAGKISEKLTSVETKVDNTKLDGRNSLKNSNFSSYIVNDSISWDKSLNGNLQVSGWGSGYNGGVADPTKGYHAHLDITTFGYPVVAFINKNSIIDRKNRWMGIAEDVVAEFARNNVAGKEITISMDIWSDTKGFRINGGLHHFIEGNTAQSFHSGQYVFNVSEVNRWERYAFTMKLHEKYDVTKVARLYIYGGEGIEGTAYVKNVKLELANVATAWTPAPEDQVTTDEFNKKTTEIEKSVEGVTTTVSTVQKNQGTMQSTLNKVEQTTNSNSQSITSLSQTQGKQGEIIQQNTSDITQLNNQIKSKVSDTQMQDYVGGLGSTNLYMNSAFEDRIITPSSGIVTSRTPSLSKWKVVATVSGAAVTPTTARQHDGYNSAQIQATGLTVNAWTGISQLFPVTSSSGKQVLSAWVFTYNKDGLDQGGALEIKFLNGSTTVTTSSVDLKDKLNNGAWTLVSVTAEVPSKAVTHVEAYIWIRRNGLIWVSQPQFQQGATPSAFMENPKDYANYDQLVGELAKKVATTDFNSKVSTLETSINQQSSRIDLKAEKKEVYSKTDSDGRFGSKTIVDSHTSQLSVMSNEINLRVKKGDIASTINQTAQSVLIQASKINLDGAVTAKSIESGRLAGVTISTSTNSTGYFVDMNQQNISLKSNVGNTGPITRGYLGFMPNLPDNTVRTALVLGNNYDNTNRLEVNGSLFLEQQTPKWNNYDLSNCRIGMARSRNSDGSINMKSSIKMGYMGSIEMRSEDSDIDIDAKGHIRMNTTRGGKSLNDIQIISGTSMSLDAYNGSWFLNSSSSKGADDWRIRTLHINDKRSGGNTQADVDFRMGHLVTLRIPQHPDYTKYGMEVKNGTGTSLSNIHVDKVYLTQNMWESTRQVKTAIKEIKVDALETLMQLQPKQYYRKSEMQKLYEKREKIVAGKYQEPMPTIKDVPLEYGFIAEEMPECLATEDRKTVSAYPLMTIGIAGTQEVYKKHLALEEIVKEQANQLAIQEDRIARLEELLLQQLIDKKPEQP